MTTPNSEPSPEKLSSAQQIFRIIQAMRPDQDAAYMAVEQIHGTELARLFLEGYAEHIMNNTAQEDLEIDPIHTAFANIGWVIVCNVTRDYGYQQLSGPRHFAILKPWAAAFDQLTDQN